MWGRLWCEQVRIEFGWDAVAHGDEALHIVLAQAEEQEAKEPAQKV